MYSFLNTLCLLSEVPLHLLLSKHDILAIKYNIPVAICLHLNVDNFLHMT